MLCLVEAMTARIPSKYHPSSIGYSFMKRLENCNSLVAAMHDGAYTPRQKRTQEKGPDQQGAKRARETTKKNPRADVAPDPAAASAQLETARAAGRAVKNSSVTSQGKKPESCTLKSCFLKDVTKVLNEVDRVVPSPGNIYVIRILQFTPVLGSISERFIPRSR